MERHKNLKWFVHIFYIMPGVRFTVRRLLRLGIEYLPMSRKNKQRLFNFFAKDVSPTRAVTCFIKVPVEEHARKNIRLTMNLQDELSRNWYFWGYSGYERGTTRLFCELLKSKSTIFDVGANIGYYATLAASILEGRGVVHAFEPAPEPYQWLQRNATLNAFACLQLNNLAMSDKDGEESLFLPSDFAWSNASLVEGFCEQRCSLHVKTTRFDTYCVAREISTVDLIHIDVEGAELKVLKGMGALIDSWSPDIICEVLEPFEASIDEFFTNRAYRRFVITDEGLQEVDKIVADTRFRDYYLSCAPNSRLLLQ